MIQGAAGERCGPQDDRRGAHSFAEFEVIKVKSDMAQAICDRKIRPWGGYICAVICLITVPLGLFIALAMLLGVNFIRGWQDHLVTWSGVAYPFLALVAGVAAMLHFRRRKIAAGFLWLALPVVNLAFFVLSVVLVRISDLPPSDF
jgi:hypothetical protein